MPKNRFVLTMKKNINGQNVTTELRGGVRGVSCNLKARGVWTLIFLATMYVGVSGVA